MTRRANSYHSYSQSPPYDYQYEERRYGKIPLGFTGKSASVKGLHAKASSFVYSPGRFSDHMFEDQFANEGSAPRASDFSVSSGGDPFRSDIQSPNFQQEAEFRSPQFQHSNAPPSENLFPGRQPQVIITHIREEFFVTFVNHTLVEKVCLPMFQLLNLSSIFLFRELHLLGVSDQLTVIPCLSSHIPRVV